MDIVESILRVTFPFQLEVFVTGTYTGTLKIRFLYFLEKQANFRSGKLTLFSTVSLDKQNVSIGTCSFFTFPAFETSSFKEKIITSFSSCAYQYDSHASIQRKSALHLHQHLSSFEQKISLQENECVSILELGSGTGSMTRLLLEAFPNAKIIVTDISKTMLELCKKNMDTFQQSRVDFLVQDIDSVSDCEQYNRIISSFTFQWSDAFEKAFEKAYRALKNGGVFALSLPLSTCFPEWKKICTTIGVPCTLNILPSKETLLSLCKKFDCVYSLQELEITKSYPNAFDFFKNLRLTGASSSKEHLSFSQFRNLCRVWDAETHGTVLCTWKIALLCLQKKY